MLQWAYKSRAGIMSLDIFSGVGLLDDLIILFLIFWGISALFFIVAARFCIPTNGAEVFPFYHNVANTQWSVCSQWWQCVTQSHSQVQGQGWHQYNARAEFLWEVPGAEQESRSTRQIPCEIPEVFMYPTGNWEKCTVDPQRGRQIVLNYPMTHLTKRTC